MLKGVLRIVLVLLFSASLFGASSLRSLYNSLDPRSFSQYMAFYELYPETPEGQEALAHVWKLLRQNHTRQKLPQIFLPKFDIQAIVSLVTRQPCDPPVKLSEQDLSAIASLCSHFPHRKLKGSQVWTKDEVLALPPEEVDLGRALLIEQFADASDPKHETRQYEASLDLMALQIAARLDPQATPIEKIKEINRYIFQEMQFRFPPHSLYAKDIDVYTFLPSVLDSRQGVCLGVSILYLCLAQRLDLPLEIITPPGHIYVRYRENDRVINIETTARGINPPSETYLGLNTRKLQERNIKEVIGMVFVNQASVFWSQGEFETCVKLYERALPYLQDDRLIHLLLGMNYLFVGRKKEAKALLGPLHHYCFDHAVCEESLATDYLEGKVDEEGLKSIFLPVDETRESIKTKQEELEALLKKYPAFRGGMMQLAVSHLQLGRLGKAREVLARYHQIDPTDPTVEYYLAVICAQRMDYNAAWKYLHEAEQITQKRDHAPIALRKLRDKLRTLCPEPGEAKVS